MEKKFDSSIADGVMEWLSGDDDWLLNRSGDELKEALDLLTFMEQYLTLAITEASIQLGIVGCHEGVTSRVTEN